MAVNSQQTNTPAKSTAENVPRVAGKTELPRYGSSKIIFRISPPMMVGIDETLRGNIMNDVGTGAVLKGHFHASMAAPPSRASR